MRKKLAGLLLFYKNHPYALKQLTRPALFSAIKLSFSIGKIDF
ncbi:hypothetical protein BARBAKC583_0166 [Bartonella bacilliformis KC583]|uniref:Uncharacterized protein n=1 Tax=Bartonella bacilliformis (strain ATCC 35685 / KC583 / Herrer 020/F12,63) TaxID=360095 RepID=A1URA1_BARBK|nr:hypothetical protein BARBAKC583_0166 [Bartonella bacilliformis KC583]